MAGLSTCQMTPLTSATSTPSNASSPCAMSPRAMASLSPFFVCTYRGRGRRAAAAGSSRRHMHWPSSTRFGSAIDLGASNSVAHRSAVFPTHRSTHCRFRTPRLFLGRVRLGAVCGLINLTWMFRTRWPILHVRVFLWVCLSCTKGPSATTRTRMSLRRSRTRGTIRVLSHSWTPSLRRAPRSCPCHRRCRRCMCPRPRQSLPLRYRQCLCLCWRDSLWSTARHLARRIMQCDGVLDRRG